jgi:hypothetical protein
MDPQPARQETPRDAGPPTGEELRRAIAELREVVRKGNVRWTRLTLLEGFGLAVAAPLAYLWLVFLLDSVLHLPQLGRFVAMTVFGAVVAGLAWRLIRNWRRARHSEDQVALAIERRTAGGVQNRLINAIQLSREPGSGAAEAGQAVILENYRNLRAMRLEQAARSRPALLRLALAGALVIVGLVFWLLFRERFTTAAARIFRPFAEVAPVYRTVLEVEPGDVEAEPGADVAITIRIKGRIPSALAVLRNVGGERATVELPVSRDRRTLTHVFPAVNQSFTYAVRGGDYVTPFHRVHVPLPCELKALRALYRFPAYTGRPDRLQDGAGGDLEALYGSRAELRFTFTQPADAVALLPERAPAISPSNLADTAVQVPIERLPLRRLGPAEFAGELVLTNLTAYRLEPIQDGRPAPVPRRYSVLLAADQPPDLQLSGMDRRQEAMADAILPLILTARDDFGLRDVALVFRRLDLREARDNAPGPTTDAAAWQTLRAWQVPDQAAAFQTNTPLPVASLDAAEGDHVEIALLAHDTDPLKAESPTVGGRCRLVIGGVGSALQILYEQILRSEAELAGLGRELEAASESAQVWTRRLDPASGLRWDDRKNLDDLAAGMAGLARGQAEIRARTAAAARAMPEQAGAVKLAVGMLADTEMVRIIRMLEMVANRDTPQDMRALLADARLTQQRAARSLADLLAQYRVFRKEWELSNMIPFVKMLAERQDKMKTESLTYAGLPPEVADQRLRQGSARRQGKLLELSGLAQTALAGLGDQAPVVGQPLASGFTNAAAAFDASGLKPRMRQAAAGLEAGRWPEAASDQQAAAAALADIHQGLLALQLDLARQALADLQRLAETSAEAQAELAKLKPGSAESLLGFDPNKAVLGEILRLQALADDLKKKHELDNIDHAEPDYKFDDSMRAGLGNAGAPTNTDFSMLKLADKPGGQRTFPDSSDLEGNPVDVKLLDAVFEDLVGDLLEEADDLREEYETYNINKTGQGLEPGNVGKQAGDMNSVSAAAATGNQKPPTHDFGGASRSGRMGARAHGLVIGDESVNRRGRDEAQDSQEVIPDQPGLIRSTQSADPQKDTATGVGGKEVKADQTSFSTKDSGEWKDDYADRMKPPQETYQIVERQGKPLSPKVADKLRDLEGKQEQLVERIKTIKKELDQLYLPSDHLDDIMAQLKANLDRLKDKPDEDVFRLQRETLDRLAGAVIVFSRPASEFQPSLPREQSVRGRVLGEPAGPVLPGYEEAVKRYYERLAQ